MKLFSSGNAGDMGILWNIFFKEPFQSKGFIKKAVKSEEEEELNPPDKENMLNEVDISATKISKIGVTFVFKGIKYCENCKNKDFINPNRVVSIGGNVFLYFENENGKKINIKVGDKVSWTQYRTTNMNPPKPITQEIKEMWNNPKPDGYGLAGLAAKKIVGGAFSGLLGGTEFSKIQDEDFICEFIDAASKNNARPIAPKEEENKDEDNESLSSVIQSLLEKKCQKTDWVIEQDEDTFICTSSIDGIELLKITFKVKD